MTSAFYRSLTNQYSDHTKWFPLSNASLWTLLNAAGVTASEWKTNHTPMEVLDIATQRLSIDSWSTLSNYCVYSFYHFMEFCLYNHYIVPRQILAEGTTKSIPSIRLHFTWLTIFFKVYDV